MLARLHLFILLSITLNCFAQKPFTGSIEYNLISVDLVSKDTVKGKLFIYALDSLVRFNYLMADGKKQESIHHLGQQKLLSLIEIDNLYFAVQIKDTATETEDYRYEKRRTKQTIQGLKCREATVFFSKGQVPIYYAKKISARYFVGFNNAPGLPIKGQIPTENGYIAYDLQQISFRQPPLSLFIPDKKYKLISLDNFLKRAQGEK
ncbi:MAG: hypothetical protein ACKOWX_08235 [Flavobacteriales bacterium]